jgi:hypothetical protein
MASSPPLATSALSCGLIEGLDDGFYQKCELVFRTSVSNFEGWMFVFMQLGTRPREYSRIMPGN